MELTIVEKQRLRSLSDLIVHNPQYARDVLSYSQSNLQPMRYEDIASLIELLETKGEADLDEQTYLKRLTEIIDKFHDKDIKAIFKSSLSVSS
ncbi:TPA: hypothetical protein RI793_003461 [Vibrio cholerae]|nr:hypothetical protein [Vibrio cholerae]